MNYKRANYLTGLSLFVISSIVYLITVHPSISFWDSGEFAACTYALSIPHAPGAPLWLILGKFAAFLPFGSNPALKLNIISALFSGATIFFLYLIIVKVIQSWKSDIKTGTDAFIVYVSSAIGALSFAFCDSFWSIAHISDIYALGAMLISICVWLLLHWYGLPSGNGSAKFLYLFSFIIGLSLGTNLIVAQLILIAGLIFYFKEFEYTRKTFFIAFIISIGALIIINPVVARWFPSLLAGDINLLKMHQISIVKWLAVLIIPAIIAGIIFSYRREKKYFVLALTSLIFVLAGYSVYTVILLRAEQSNLLVNEQNPGSMEALSQYISSEKNINPHFWPRRYSKQDENTSMWTNYSGDIGFLWNYQMNHLFTRYLGWQYIGRAGDDQGSGSDWKKFYGIPLFMGLFGMFYHFRKNWKL